MIGVSSSSQSFRALGRYLVAGRTGQEEGRIAWSTSRNLPTDDPELAAKIMRASAAENVRVSQPVYHLALSFDRNDLVDRAAMERVADRVLKALKLDGHQALIVAHGDRLHPHVHLLVNRVHPETGKVWDRWQDYPVIQRVLREEEAALGLRAVESSVAPDRRIGEGKHQAIHADFDKLERVAELGRKRYEVEMDIAGSHARLAQVDAVARSYESAQARLDAALTQIYRDPSAAKSNLVDAAVQAGDAEALARLRVSPERFGALNTTTDTRGWGHVGASDEQARGVAARSVGIADEFLKARRELSALGMPVQVPPQNVLAIAVPVNRAGLDISSIRERIEAAGRASTEKLHEIRLSERALPSRGVLEARLGQALRRLTPWEFERFRMTLSGERLTLSYNLRRMARDAVLGRDEPR